MNKTADTMPDVDGFKWILGRGPGIADHIHGEYALMFYDGRWWNEDGTELCADDPEEWIYIDDLPRPLRSDQPEDGDRWILGYHVNEAVISGHVHGHHGIMRYRGREWFSEGGLTRSPAPTVWAYIDDLLASVGKTA